jgi:hypothetical protein
MPSKKPELRRIDDDYPPVERDGYADTMRKRREENARNAELARDIAYSRKADVFGMEELLKRLDDYDRRSFPGKSRDR